MKKILFLFLLLLTCSGIPAQTYQDEAHRKKSEESLTNMAEFFSFVFPRSNEVKSCTDTYIAQANRINKRMENKKTETE